MKSWLGNPVAIGCGLGGLVMPALRAFFFQYVYSTINNINFQPLGGPVNILLLCLPSLIWGTILGGGAGSVYLALKEGRPEDVGMTCRQVGGICFWLQAIMMLFILGCLGRSPHGSVKDSLFAIAIYLAGNIPFVAATLMYLIGLSWRGRPVQISKNVRL